MIPTINERRTRRAFPRPNINSGKSTLNPMEKKAILYNRFFEKLAEDFVSIKPNKISSTVKSSSTKSSTKSSSSTKATVATPKSQSLQKTSPTSFSNNAGVRVKTVNTTSKV